MGSCFFAVASLHTITLPDTKLDDGFTCLTWSTLRAGEVQCFLKGATASDEGCMSESTVAAYAGQHVGGPSTKERSINLLEKRPPSFDGQGK